MSDQSIYKSYFLGPKAENESWVRGELQNILDEWFHWRKNAFPQDEAAITKEERRSTDFLERREQLAQAVSTLNDMFADEVPKFTPRYMAHMVSDLALPAIMGHIIGLIHNPNITSREAAKVAGKLEDETIAMLAEMVGFDPSKAKGHATGGGTVANLEAIWRARFRQDHWLSLALYLFENKGIKLDLFDSALMGWAKFEEMVEAHDIDIELLRNYSAIADNPYAFGERMTAFLGSPYRGPIILVPQNKHFSWAKGTNIFGLGEASFWPVALDKNGKMQTSECERLIMKAKQENRPLMMCVGVTGTTETGQIDPIHEIQDMLDRLQSKHGWDIWHHVDAAYGGFLCTMLRGKAHHVLTEANQKALNAISRVHSVTIDPHKLGYVPYACGVFLTKNSNCYTVSSFKAPYLERTQYSEEKWSTTLEGSRAGTGITATWLTGKTLGFHGEGMGEIIANSIVNCNSIAANLESSLAFLHPLKPIDSNLLCFNLASDGDSLKDANIKTDAVYKIIEESPNFSVSKTVLSIDNYPEMLKEHLKSFNGVIDDRYLILIRCVFMNPFWSEERVSKPLQEELIEFIRSSYNAL